MKKMWQEIQNKLGIESAVDDAGVPDPHLKEFAAAALLIDVALSDHDLSDEEWRSISLSMHTEFDLAEQEIDNLMERAKQRVDDQSSFHPHVKVINENCDPEEKFELLHMLWRVAYADGRIDRFEEHYLRRVAKLLHLSHEKFIKAKLAVLEE